MATTGKHPPAITRPAHAQGDPAEGMIGYMLEQELGNELPFERHVAGR